MTKSRTRRNKICRNFDVMKLSFGKLLFPQMPEEQRRHQLRILLASLMVGLVISGIVVFIMLMSDQMTKYWIAKL